MTSVNYPKEYLLRLSGEQHDRFADYRFNNRISSAAAALRQLIDLGLEAVAAREAKTEDQPPRTA